MTAKQFRQIEKLMNETWGWHGTGMYQYDSNGDIITVLDSIIDKGGLLPLIVDPWLEIEGELRKSVSIAKIRMYARIYAETMQYDSSDIKYLYFSSKFWFWIIGISYFIHSPISIASHILALQFKKNSSIQLDNLISKFRNTESLKRKKFLTKLMNIPKTDIKDNFGIIIGIRNMKSDTFKMDKRYSLYEERLGKRIPLDMISYIEVPECKVQIVRDKLRNSGLNISVLAIENVERYYSELGFLSCLRVQSL